LGTAIVRTPHVPARLIVCGAAIAPLEGPLFRHWFGFTLAAFFLALSLPFLVVLWTIDRLGSRVAAVLPHNRKRPIAIDTCSQSSWAENEFRFEEAIEKYEELIDATARRSK
jgi:hypothetical protein